MAEKSPSTNGHPRVGADNAGREDPRSALRRTDRGKDDKWVRAFLERAQLGFLATVDEDGQPFLNSNLFVYDAERHAIYLHTHRTGRTRSNLDRGGKVAFSSAAAGRMLPADTALEFSIEYSGVVAFGRGHVVDDPDEARAALQALLDKYAPHLKPGRDYRSITPEELERTAVHRIDIETWSGKEKAAPTDFPGAYDLSGVAVPFPSPTPSAK